MRLLTSKNLLILNALVLLACAKEVSDEEKRREENNRQYDRYAAASGVFEGYVEHSDGKGIPATLAVVAKRNPTGGDDQPVLDVTLQLGMFGGVTITAGDASYDWGTGIVTAKFPRGGGGGQGQGQGQQPGGQAGAAASDSLELRARINNGQLSDATLVGPRTGTHDMFMRPKANAQLEAAHEYQVGLTLTSTLSPESRPVAAVLSMRRDTTDIKPPLTSDMPLLPPLRSSLRFQALADAPQQALITYYDPLTGTLDAVLGDSRNFVLDNLFVPIDSGNQTLQLTTAVSTTGVVSVASKTIGQVQAVWTPNVTNLTNNLAGLPPRTYYGTYKGTSGGRELNVVGTFDFFGSTVANPSEFGFSSFPKMRIYLDICLGGRVQERRAFDASAFDYLNSKIYMMWQQDPGSQMQLRFSQGWEALDGYIMRSGTPRGGTDNPANYAAEVHLRAPQADQQVSCKTLDSQKR